MTGKMPVPLFAFQSDPGQRPLLRLLSQELEGVVLYSTLACDRPDSQKFFR